MKWNEYRSEIKKALDMFAFDDEILDVLNTAKKDGRKIFVGGNGGSACLALHYVCDLSKGANRDWKYNENRCGAICLSSNMGYMTAIANDEEYKDIFREQLINLGEDGDVLILISSSGNSQNVIEAARYGKEKGMIVIGICGFDGGLLKEEADYTAHVPYDSYEVCEDMHAVFGHFLAICLRTNKDFK